MIREIIGAKTVVNMFSSKKKRRKNVLPSVSTIGILAGAGLAYMAIRKRNNENVEEND